MKITAQSRYALRILLDVALHGGAGVRSIKEISGSQDISEKFASRIVVPLRRAGLLETERGAKGGVRLARMPEKITLLDIVEAVDGPLALVECLAKPGVCPRQGRCAAESAWRGVDEALSEALRATTLAAVAAESRKLEEEGMGEEPDYCI